MAERANGEATSRRRSNSKSTREMIGEGVPPQNLDAERAVLGSILRDHLCMLDVVQVIKEADFYSANHQKIFQTMTEMFERNEPIDVLTVGEHLARKNLLNEIGGAATLMGLFEGILTAAGVTHYAKIVHEKAILRNLIHVSTEILRDSYEGQGNPEETLAEAEKKIFSILENRVTQGTSSLKDVMKSVFDRISDRHRKDGSHCGGVPSPFFDLDEMTNGWQESELIILAARPSMGKTAFALNLVEHVAVDQKMPTLFVSLEMSELELGERLLCSRARFNSHTLRRGRATGDDMPHLVDVTNELSEAPLYIDDLPGQTMLKIGATARRLKRKHDIKLIVIDYLQLIEADDKGASRQEQITTISRRLKNLARDVKVPVIALSQLNRASESREGHRPRMSDLRESGSIEQDADVVLLLHRDDAYDPQDNPNTAEVIIAKQRNGPVGDVKLTFRKEMTRFENFHQEIAPFGAPGNDSF